MTQYTDLCVVGGVCLCWSINHFMMKVILPGSTPPALRIVFGISEAAVIVMYWVTVIGSKNRKLEE